MSRVNVYLMVSIEERYHISRKMIIVLRLVDLSQTAI
jgi:hypothetical protein